MEPLKWTKTLDIRGVVHSNFNFPVVQTENEQSFNKYYEASEGEYQQEKNWIPAKELLDFASFSALFHQLILVSNFFQ